MPHWQWDPHVGCRLHVGSNVCCCPNDQCTSVLMQMVMNILPPYWCNAERRWSSTARVPSAYFGHNAGCINSLTWVYSKKIYFKNTVARTEDTLNSSVVWQCRISPKLSQFQPFIGPNLLNLTPLTRWELCYYIYIDNYILYIYIMNLNSTSLSM